MDATADDWMFDGDDGGEETSSGFSAIQDKMSDWGNRMQDRVRQSRQEGAKKLGKFAEDGAAKTGSAAGKNGSGNSSFTSAVQNSRNAEKSGGSFANNVQGKTLDKAAAASMPGGKIIVNQAKKLGPFGTILMIIMVLVGVFAGSQSMAPFGLVSNGLDQFNNLRTSMNRRNTYFNRFSLNRRHNVSITKASIFGTEKFKISNRISKKLGKQNIVYVDTDDFDCRFLLYQDNDTGKTYAIAANDNDVNRLPSGGVDVEVDGEIKHFDVNTKMKIDDAIIDSDNFTRSLDVGTRTLKGHIAGWFDDISAKFHKRIGSSRNKFRDAPDTADDEDIKKRAKPGGTDEGLDETIRSTTDSEAEERKTHMDTDENGRPIEVDDGPEHINTDGDGIGKNASQDQISGALNTRVKAVVGSMKAGTDIACTIMKAYSMLSVLMAGVMVANILNYITGFLESVQKTQIGDGGKNELAYYMNGLSQKGNTTDSDGNVVRENTNSLMSPAWNQFFSSGGLVLHSNDEVAEKFNTDMVMKNGIDESTGIIGTIVSSGYSITNLIGGGIAAYKGCLTAQAAMASIDLVVDVVLAFISVGIGTFIKSLLQDLWKDVVLAVVVGAIMAAFMALLPHIAQWMAKDLISNMAGEDAAYAINSGFNIYLGRQMQSSSGLPATEDKLMAHWRLQQEVIAEEGAFERSMRSPFDPTSKYTFVGSIVNSLIPIANTWSSPLVTVSKIAGTVGTAATSLRPTANAEGEAKFQTSLRHDCPNLSEIGLVGDVFCNPYFVTDTSTISEDPPVVFDKVATDLDKQGINDNFIWDNVDDEKHNGNPDINPESDLGKWVVSCAARDSQFGQVDSNVINAIASLYNTGNSTVDTVLETGVGLLPFVGDAQDIVDAAKQAGAMDWATGENCIKEEYKYYSRYSEDQRLMESAGIIEQSAVGRFLDDYYEKNPIDNSWEGTVARYSGMTKDEVEDTLALLDYIEWYADYDPTDYGPEKSLPKADKYQYESNDIIASAEKAIIGDYIVYDDLRTKTKIA